MTKDRIQKWNPGFVTTCALCKTEAESKKHLFFQCEYAKKMWNAVKCLIQMDQCTKMWDDIENCNLQKNASGKIWSIFQRIAWAARVYYIWFERNFRIF